MLLEQADDVSYQDLGTGLVLDGNCDADVFEDVERYPGKSLEDAHPVIEMQIHFQLPNVQNDYLSV